MKSCTKVDSVRYLDGAKYYIEHWGKYNKLLAGENIMGDVIHSLEEWNNNPYKYEIMKDAIMFKEFLHKMSASKWYWPSKIGPELGSMGHINTPIMLVLFGPSTIEEYINCFEEAVNQVAEKFIIIPKSLKGTDLGRRILLDLRNAEKNHLFGENVFCHMRLNYESFVLKNNELIGIRQWRYSGYYPAELENIIHSVQSNKCYELLSNFGSEICEVNPTGIMVIFKLECKDEIHCEDFLNEPINVASCGNTGSGFVCIIK